MQQKSNPMTARRTLILTLTALCATLWCAAGVISGTITCDGVGVSHVSVSDGYELARTDANGHYSFNSQKKNGYVFYSLPGGYEPAEATNGFMPQFWAMLDSHDVSVNEVHDFALRRVDNDKHIMLFGADSHLARRYGDRNAFRNGFVKSVTGEVERAGGTPVYSMILGDLTWDWYWTMNDYNLNNFMADLKTYKYPVPLWPVIGNHDNDPSIPYGPTVDFDAAGAWRNIVCPNYYSFNLGKVHYVVLDDIYYLNYPEPGYDYPAGVAGQRNFLAKLTEEQIAWLKKDLTYVNYNTPVVVCVHIPIWSLSSTFGVSSRLNNVTDLCNALANYRDVHVVSGHIHTNYCAHPAGYSNIMEHNIAAICATWWWTNWYTGKHVCPDGSPGGYSLWNVDGDRMRWTFRAIGTENPDRQMRIYDMNTVRNFYNTNGNMKAIMAAYPSRINYGNIGDNQVMVNVFAYDIGWQISICEGDELLSFQRYYTEDPFHTLTYDVPRFAAAGDYSTDFAASYSLHLFRAMAHTATQPITVRVIDSFGNIYLETITRPHNFIVNMDQNQHSLAVGDVNMDGEVNIADLNDVIGVILGDGNRGFPWILADCNGTNEVDIADVNTIIDIVLKN